MDLCQALDCFTGIFRGWGPLWRKCASSLTEISWPREVVQWMPTGQVLISESASAILTKDYFCRAIYKIIWITTSFYLISFWIIPRGNFCCLQGCLPQELNFIFWQCLSYPAPNQSLFSFSVFLFCHFSYSTFWSLVWCQNMPIWSVQNLRLFVEEMKNRFKKTSFCPKQKELFNKASEDALA